MRSIGIDQVGLLGGVVLSLALGGCNSFDDKAAPDAGQGHLVIPVDSRPAVAPTAPLRPVSGGTLTVTADGQTAIAADPERDQVTIVDLASFTVRHTVTLQAGDEPGRSIEDADKRVHVALRGGGSLVSIDPVSGSIVDRRAVCKAPRGLAFDATTKLVHVACSEGKLVSLPSAGGAAVRTLTLEPDLRDVLVRGSELWVTTFKSAQVLRVSSAAGTLDNRITIPQGKGQLTQPAPPIDEFGNQTFGGQIVKDVAVTPGVAWRAVGASGGGAVIVHQEAVADEIEISEPSTSGSAYGGGGGGFDCSGIVKTAVSRVDASGNVVTTQVAGAPLPVDVAVSSDQAFIAVAHAGPSDVEAPRPFVEFPSDDGDISGDSFGGPAFGGSFGTLSIHSTVNLNADQPCAFSEGSPTMDGVTAVAFIPNSNLPSGNQLLAQVQQPPQLLIIRELPWGAATSLALPGEARVDTGHELFHRDSGGGIACASCHPEGGEDGHTWRFADTGERRTQALHVGLEGTAPFHWAGDLPNVGSLMTEVFVQRMGGVRQSGQRLEALTAWLFSLKAPPALRDNADEVVLRGKELFDSAAVGCATCHSGEKLTNNQSVAIDTVKTTKLQVPSLVGIAYRAPFMHTGCATTLTARFNPECGGNAHGNTAQLSPAELGDLVAYLESL